MSNLIKSNKAGHQQHRINTLIRHARKKSLTYR